MIVSKYYDSVRTYLTLPKDVGFDYMESILAEMEEDGLSFTAAYDLFGELVDYVMDMERV